MNSAEPGAPAVGRLDQSAVQCTASPDDMQQEENLDIAIVGMAGRFPGASNINSFWQNLRSGKESITFFSDEELSAAGINDALIGNQNYVKAAPILQDVKAFDGQFFGYTPRDARMMDPQHRLFLEEAWHALEHAGYYGEGIEGPVGVFAGSAMNTYLLFSGLLPRFVDEYLPTLIGSDKDFLTTRVSYKLNLKGPSITIQTACSTSLVAVHMACQSLLNGESDMALAGGVSVRVPHIAGHMYAQGSVFTPDGHCRPFDARAQGTIFGSGVGVIVLKRFEDAVEDRDTIYAIIKGSAVNNDGSSKADYTAPSIQSQADVITEALAVAGVDAGTISYVEAHGTGTYLGDPIEVAALTRAFRGYTDKKGFCRIGSVKSNVGHLDAAAGMAGLFKTILSLQHNTIPATINFEQANPEIDFANSPFIVNDTLSPWEAENGPRRAGVTALGIGGTNAHVILEEAPVVTKRQTSSRNQLLVFSARTPVELAQTTSEVGEHIASHTTIDLQDIAYTLQTGRKTFEHRRFCVTEELAGAASALRLLDDESVVTLEHAGYRQSTVFMFSGQGSQYVQMAGDLYKKESVFRKWIDKQAAFLEPKINCDMRRVVFPSSEEEDTAAKKLKQTNFAQPALFMVEYALAMLWQNWGVKPAALIGHSIGEYVAACIAGVFSWEDALSLVFERGRLMQMMPAGLMLAVQASEQETQPYLNETIALAAVNGASFCVVSGAEEAIKPIEQKLNAIGISCRLLHTSHAFHSSMMEPMLEAFGTCVEQSNLKGPSIPLISNVTGSWLKETEAINPEYWSKQLRQTVLFDQGLTELLKESGRVFLEVGPGNTLGTFVRKHKAFTKDHTVLTSLRHPSENACDQKKLLNTAGHLWANGIPLDWDALHQDERPLKIGLPTYPFARTKHWYEAREGKRNEEKGQRQNGQSQLASKVSPVEERGGPEDWYYVPSWKRSRRLDQTIQQLAKSSSFLVFARGDLLDTRFVEFARTLGHQVVCVFAGSEFEEGEDKFFIDPASQQDYHRFLEQLDKRDLFPRYVAHFWNCHVTKPGVASGKTGIETFKEQAFYTQFYLAKALWQGKWDKKPIRTGIVASELFDVMGEEPIVPAKALLLGPGLVLPKEMPAYESFIVDVSSHEDHDLDIYCKSLMAEFATDITEPESAFRGKYKWVNHYEQFPLKDYSRVAQQATDASKIRDGGVYLITGGLGGVGLALAASLAARVNPKLVLVGRSELPDRAVWDNWISTHDLEDATSQKIAAVQQLELSGAEVWPCSADVADESSLRNLVDLVINKYGQVDGVVHAAGVIADGFVPLKERDTVEKVLEAKVYGTSNLGKILKDLEPDFFFLCSSVNAHLAPAGQVDYVAANRFMDHFAAHYTTETGIQTQAINWPGWTEVGMLAKNKSMASSKPLWLKDALHRGITTEQGTRAFYNILKTGLSNVIVSPVRFPYPSKSSGDANFLREGVQASVSMKSTSEHTGVHKNGVPADKTLEAQLQTVWAEVLEVEEVGVHDNFFDLGGHSLLAITLFAEIERQIGKLDKPLSALLEAPTISRFARQIGKTESEDQWTPLVTIQEGESAPLFCVHGAGGNVLIYQQLALQLGRKQSVYGLQSPGLDGKQALLTSIEDLASLYVNEIISAFPEGPHILLGYCMGGTIVWEMAQQLKSKGYTNVLILMLETYNWKNLKKDSLWQNLRYYAEKVSFHAGNYRHLNEKGKRKFIGEKYRELKRRQKMWLGNMGGKRGRAAKIADGIDLEALANVWQTNDEAALAYEPEKYDGPAIHIRPRKDYSCHTGSDMSWDALAPNLETIVMPVYPAGMLVPPFVTTLAQRINEVLAAFEKEEPDQSV